MLGFPLGHEEEEEEVSRMGVKRRRRCTARVLYTAALVFAVTICTAAEENEEPAPPAKQFNVSPFFAPVYTPELGILFTGGALFSFSTQPANPDLILSNINASLGYSTRSALLFQSLLKTYWLDDTLRVYADLWYKNLRDHYWGVGYANGRYTEKGGETTSYDRSWWKINPKVYWQFRQYLFAGLNLDFNKTRARNLSAGVAADPYLLGQGTDNYNGGAGLIFMYDSRDLPVNAYTGWYLSGTATFYGRYLGSDNTYQIYEIDYRQYRQIVRPGSTLAWQVCSRFGSETVPWPEMTQIGTPFDLRGYYWGRYRDIAGIFGLLEYRFKFLTDKTNRFRRYEGRKESRHGFVTWLGVGWVGSRMRDLGGNLLPNAGVGYRFEVQPRLNVRVDFGWGVESFGVYVNFTEAF